MSFVCAKFHVDSCGRKDVISYLQWALSLILCNGGYRTCYMSDMSYAKYLHMIDYLTYIQLNRHPIENLHLILSLFPRPLQSLTHPSLPWCWRQNKASLCLISFSSMPVPRRSLLRPALSELFMEFPPVLLDGKREVLCWSWSGPLGLQYAGMIFPWQPTKQTPVGR